MPVRKRGSSWEASVNHCGARKRKTCGTKREADTWVRNETLALKVDPTPDVPKTLGGMIDYGIEYVWSQNTLGKTYPSYGRRLRRLLGEKFKLTSVTPTVRDRLVVQLQREGLAPGTVTHHLKMFSRILAMGREMGLKIRDLEFTFPRGQSRDRVITPDEENVILDVWAPHPYLADVYTVLVDTGLRIGELLNLTWDALDWETCQVEVRNAKNGDTRTVGMTRRVQEVLSARQADMPSGPFAGIADRTLGNHWRAWRAKLPEPLSNDTGLVPHALRHTCATRLSHRGMDLASLQKWLGHRTAEMVLRYAHALPATAARGAELLERN